MNGSRTSARFAYWGSYMICMHSFALVFVARRIFKRGYGSSVFRIDAMHLSRPRYTYVAGSLQILLLTQSTYVQDREDGIVIEMGFAIFILFKDLIDFNPELRERIEPDEMEAMTDAGTSITYAMAWSFFADKTKSVEIARDGFLEYKIQIQDILVTQVKPATSCLNGSTSRYHPCAHTSRGKRRTP